MTEFSAKEWEDITPIPQNDGPNPVVSIAYTPECKCALPHLPGTAFYASNYTCTTIFPKFVLTFLLHGTVFKVTRLHDIFRGVVARGELSERVLHLTEELLELNPANYTVW